MRSLLGLSSLLASLVALVVARGLEMRHKAIPNKRHTQARVVRGLDAPRNRSLTNEMEALGSRDLEKRFEAVRFTFYDAGLGACGQYNTNADFIVALNANQFDSARHCGESITIIANGKTATAVIMDRCEGCPYAGLDFSRGLFRHFADESAGVLSGDWYFGGAPAPPAVTPTPTPTPTPAPTPTTTYYTPPPPSTTTSPVAYTPSSSSSSSSSRVLSSSYRSSSTSSAIDALVSGSPNTTTSSSPGGVLEQFNLVLVNFGAIVVVGRSN